jgi:hypothetical protein
MKRGLLLGLMFLFLAYNVNAIGLAPAKLVIDYVPGAIVDHKITVINNVDEPAIVQIYITEELAHAIEIGEVELFMKANEIREIPIKIVLPMKMDKPGGHQAIIRVMATPESATEGIKVVGSVQMSILVKVPYDKPFLELKASAKDANVGEELVVNIKISNLGEVKIDELRIISELSDLENNILDKKTFPSVGLGALKSFERTAKFDTADFKPGIYKSNVIVSYDGEAALEVIEARIGDLFVGVESYDRYLPKKGIVKFNFNATSMWSSILRDVYADVILIKDGVEVYNVRTPSMSMEPWQTLNFNTFIDTTNLELGGHDLKIIMNYNGKTTKVEGKIGIIEAKGQGDTLIYIVAVLFILIVLMELRWLKSKD